MHEVKELGWELRVIKSHSSLIRPSLRREKIQERVGVTREVKTQVIGSKNLEKKELQGDKVYKISYQKVTPRRMGVCTYKEANQSPYWIIGDFRQRTSMPRKPGRWPSGASQRETQSPLGVCFTVLLLMELWAQNYFPFFLNLQQVKKPE